MTFFNYHIANFILHYLHCVVVFRFRAFNGTLFAAYFYVVAQFIAELSYVGVGKWYDGCSISRRYYHLVDIEAHDFVVLDC